MPRTNEFEVDFAKYCELCQHWDKDETQEPCCQCLYYSYNEESRKPVYYKEADTAKKA